MACVTAWVSLEVVLMLGLGFPEGSSRHYFGHDPSGPAARGIDLSDCLLGDATLLVTDVENRGAIACPDVVALAVQGRRVVDLEEEFEELSVRDSLGIEDDLERLRVTVMVAVGRIRNVAAGVADPCRNDAGSLPKEILHSPETSSGKDRLLNSVPHVSTSLLIRFGTSLPAELAGPRAPAREPRSGG